MMGLPASGKSSLARAFSVRSGWPVIDRDLIRAQLFPGGRLAADEKPAADQALYAQLAAQLRAGRHCIADGKTWATDKDRVQLQQWTADCAARLQWVWLDCPVEIAVRRIAADHAHPGRDPRAGLVQEVAARWKAAPADALRLDGALPTAELLPQLLVAVSALR